MHIESGKRISRRRTRRKGKRRLLSDEVLVSRDSQFAQLRSFYAGKSVLITGGASFIGSHLADLLAQTGARLTVADDLSSGKIENLSRVRDRICFHRGDLRDEAFCRMVSASQQVVFHLAARHGGRGYIETHPVECVSNMQLDHVVYSAAVHAGVRRIIFASSACVYPVNLQSSEQDRRLLRESDANFEEPGKAFSDGEYGWSKLMGELQLRAFCKQYGITGVACRIFTVYGERENETHAVIGLIAKALARLDPYPIWGSGLQTRNFTYVADTATGLALAGARLEGFETINVGISIHYTVLELLEEIFSCLHWRPSSLQRQLDKPVGVLSRASDNERCLRLLEWEPATPLYEGIRRTTTWYRKIASSTHLRQLDRLLMERAPTP